MGRLVAMSYRWCWNRQLTPEWCRWIPHPLQNWWSIWWIHSELGTYHPNFGDHIYPAEAQPPQILPQHHVDCAYKTSISPGYQWWWNVRLHNALARGSLSPLGGYSQGSLDTLTIQVRFVSIISMQCLSLDIYWTAIFLHVLQNSRIIHHQIVMWFYSQWFHPIDG